ncbi:hypothetical protein WJ41_29640 [Burkholderia ubonensis]|nr:hypothetical protein WJ41_29640 [Burkholderia ubonensis]KVU05488.1 hypothetical protein WK61_32000 [Burkholderia ubonensis]
MGMAMNVKGSAVTHSRHDTALVAGESTKRRRSRPRKPDALSSAQRSAAYRARRRTAEEFVTVTKIPPAAVDAYDALVATCDALRDELGRTRHERDEARQQTAAALSTWTAHERVLLPAVDQLLAPIPPYDGHDKRLSVMVEFRAHSALERLKTHRGLEPREVIERLLWRVDELVVDTFGDDDVAYRRYIAAARG